MQRKVSRICSPDELVGVVVSNTQTLQAEVENIAARQCTLNDAQKAQIDQVFAFRDHSNYEIIFGEIKRRSFQQD